MDDGGAIGYTSAPKFEDFRARIDCEPTGNRSLLFLRTDHSWHGVEPLRCPEVEMRKVFIVECSMPVAVFNYIFAQRYGRAAEDVASLVLVSTLLAFALLPFLLAWLL